jgi:hypothetical protein
MSMSGLLREHGDLQSEIKGSVCYINTPPSMQKNREPAVLMVLMRVLMNRV